MRSFSKLKALCAFPETIDKPSKRRDDAAALGTLFHKCIELWAASGDASHFEATEDPVRGWLRRMLAAWTPPAGLRVEVAVGLADAAEPAYVEVDEPEPHIYVAKDGTPLLTAGRADLVWIDQYGILNVVDIKTGQFYLGEPWDLRQLQAQALACAKQTPVESVRVGIYYARLGLFDWGYGGSPVVVGSDLWDDIWGEVRAAAKMPAEPRPGAHCLSCWSKRDCPANPEVAA